jgi:CBS domain-containing protein
MKVWQVMTRPVEVVEPSDSLRTAAEHMRAVNVGSIPVVDGENRPIGVLTDRDIVVRGLALGYDPDAATVSEVMSDELQGCAPDTAVEDAAALMKRHQIRRLVVVNDRRELVGIVSLGDLAQEASEHLAGETLEAISEPAPPLP